MAVPNDRRRIDEVLKITAYQDSTVGYHLNQIKVQLGGHGSNTVGQLIQYMRTLDTETRANFSQDLLQFLEVQLTAVQDSIDNIYSAIAGDAEVLQRLNINETILRTQYPAVATTAERARAARDRRGEAYKVVEKAWGETVGMQLREYGFFNTENTAKAVAALANKESNWTNAAIEMNRLFMYRLNHGGPGQKKTRHITPVDIQNAAKAKTARPGQDYSITTAQLDAQRLNFHRDAKLRLLGIENMPNNLLEKLEFTPTPRRITSGPSQGPSTPTPGGSQPYVPSYSLSRPPPATGSFGSFQKSPSPRSSSLRQMSLPGADDDEDEGPYRTPPEKRTPPRRGSFGSFGTPEGEGTRLIQQFSETRLSPSGSPDTLERFVRGQSRRPSESSLSGVPYGSLSPSRINPDDPTLLAANSPSHSRRGSNADYTPRGHEQATGGSSEQDDDDPTVSTLVQDASQEVKEKRCSCYRNRVATSVLDNIMRGAKTESNQLLILAEYISQLKPTQRDSDLTTFCNWHRRRLAGEVVGLKTKYKKGPELAKLLYKMYAARSSILHFKIANAEDFRKSHRPPVQSDTLGPYRFFPQPPKVIHYIDEATAKKWLSALIPNRKPEDVLAEFKDRGTINLPIFDWLVNDPEILELIKDEFDLYEHHLREVSGNPNLGWCRTMVYSIVQQVVRQYPGYWMLYAALRPDHLAWLISYPYYTKYAKANDRTGFRHIDLNINRLVEDNRGGNMIQGSLSFDNEVEKACTILVPKMQHYMKEWRNRIQKRKDKDGSSMLKNGYVQAITDKMLTKQDLKDFGTEWEKVPCKKGEVRVTLPHLPHGAEGPAPGTRRTMLPWFVGILADHETLEIAEGGGWSSLRQANLDLTAPPLTPSGHPNKYGKIPFAFPAAVVVDRLGPISDALVGRRRWDDAMVQMHLSFWIKDWSVDTIKSNLESWQANVKGRMKALRNEVIKLEKRAFPKEKSYYENVNPATRRVANRPAPDRDAPLDNEDLAIVREEGEGRDVMHLEQSIADADISETPPTPAKGPVTRSMVAKGGEPKKGDKK